MKNYAEFYNLKLDENLDETLSDKLSETYKSLKRGVLSLVEESVDNPDELINVQNFINDYIEENSEVVLVGLVEDTEVFDMYLKYQADIDELLDKEINYFEDAPVDNNVFSLYDYVITGTKRAVKIAIEKIYEEVFEV